MKFEVKMNNWMDCWWKPCPCYLETFQLDSIKACNRSMEIELENWINAEWIESPKKLQINMNE